MKVIESQLPYLRRDNTFNKGFNSFIALFKTKEKKRNIKEKEASSFMERHLLSNKLKGSRRKETIPPISRKESKYLGNGMGKLVDNRILTGGSMASCKALKSELLTFNHFHFFGNEDLKWDIKQMEAWGIRFNLRKVPLTLRKTGDRRENAMEVDGDDDDGKMPRFSLEMVFLPQFGDKNRKYRPPLCSVMIDGKRYGEDAKENKVVSMAISFISGYSTV